jgi:hypothetical protein
LILLEIRIDVQVLNVLFESGVKLLGRCRQVIHLGNSAESVFYRDVSAKERSCRNLDDVFSELETMAK